LVAKFKISQFSVPVIIGVYPQERQQPQDVLIDLEFSFDNKLAALHDDLSQTIDYASLCQQLSQALQQTRFKLIEALVEFIADFCLENFAIETIKVSLTKKPFDMPQVAGGVTIEIKKSVLVSSEI
jgi:7,8-dihydroneopterin aldolase/epimerase/oxygenase